ncbi:MAG: helicase-related protein [Deinococcales bacterium]
MIALEKLSKGMMLKGLSAHEDDHVTIIDVKKFGSEAVELTYKTSKGDTKQEILYRYREAELQLFVPLQVWDVQADGRLLRLTSEAYRIKLAHLFDPHLAIHTSQIEPLPHQITAVYESMLPRQPLRFLLADDPGAGKTIMAGLLIKELLIRGDLKRCLIVCPGGLVEQWQTELQQRFQMTFDIMTSESLKSSYHMLHDRPLLIARLDKLARDDELKKELAETEWDLIIGDEAHKMSASFFGSEMRVTKRYQLGQLLAKISRHFLLMTATPHNGKEEDFQLFMALLDSDRFEGRFREGVHNKIDHSDLMRRLIKEQLLKFDATPLFPERRAHAVAYNLHELEAKLYAEVSNYVRQEFNRAEALEENRRKGTVGFALTVLQRRLASSPEAIYQSLFRRRERLEERLKQEKLERRQKLLTQEVLLDEEDIAHPDDFEDEMGEYGEEAKVLDQASAARTIAELEAEIEILKKLEHLALTVKRQGKDRKWEELSKLLQEDEFMYDASGLRRKLIIFTEHKDTLNYLVDRISRLLGRPEAVVSLHGALSRDERQRIQGQFTQNKEVLVLVATDAAGEGINLQRAHLMVNYDLPWNPNRLEQRFGRIHRIGQSEVCHLWNLVAQQTREGDVFYRLFEKLEQERKALGGRVFDVLGKLTFENKPLRELLIDAVRYGDDPKVRAKLYEALEDALDRNHLEDLLSQHALVQDAMSFSRVQHIREQMERAEAKRLQPYFVAEFFLKAFKYFGGKVFERETGRYEITYVPKQLGEQPKPPGTREGVLGKYERITFDKKLIYQHGKPLALHLVPGHPLLHAVTHLLLENEMKLLKQGVVLVDDNNLSDKPRYLFYIEQIIEDGRKDANGHAVIVSRQMHFVELEQVSYRCKNAGYAPYLDYRPLEEQKRRLLANLLTVLNREEADKK